MEMEFLVRNNKNYKKLVDAKESDELREWRAYCFLDNELEERMQFLASLRVHIPICPDCLNENLIAIADEHKRTDDYYEIFRRRRSHLYEFNYQLYRCDVCGAEYKVTQQTKNTTIVRRTRQPKIKIIKSVDEINILT